MGDWLKRQIKSALYHLPGKKYILLESNPPMEDNTGALFQKMLERGWNRRYRLGWVLYEPGRENDIRGRNVTALSADTPLRRLRLILALCRAAAIVDCNLQVKKLYPGTVHLYLAHGSPIKSVGDYYGCDETTDHMLNQAPFFTEINAREFHIAAEKLVTLGYPRNDLLLSEGPDLRQYFGPRFRRFVVWYPTYRQHRSGVTYGGAYEAETAGRTAVGIPVLDSPEGALEVNAAAEKNSTLLIVKPHPAQDLSMIRMLELSNIVFIDDAFFVKHGVGAYAFLGSSDGLITDYSSVFYDYLLLDKPIGLAIQDIEEYRRCPGFAVDMELLEPAAERLDTAADFERFFADIASGRDMHAGERRRLRDLTNTYTDGASAERVLDFLEERLG